MTDLAASVTARPAEAGPDVGLYRPAGSLAAGPWALELTPEGAGWTYAGLRVAELASGGSIAFETGADEVAILPLAGHDLHVLAGDQAFQLEGREDVFAGPTDFVFVPPGHGVRLTASTPARVAVATTRAQAGSRIPIHVPAADVPLELRGAGASSREVRNFGRPEALDADRMIAVEVLSPGGGWSSWPPHKHDQASPDESVLEEIYYYEIAAGPAGPGLAYQRVYGTAARPIDVLVEVRQGDVVLVPHGWHGPTMAAPGYDLYYLNVMAGPDPDRSWRIVDDPAHGWIRGTWQDQTVDPRLPFGGQRPGRSDL